MKVVSSISILQNVLNIFSSLHINGSKNDLKIVGWTHYNQYTSGYKCIHLIFQSRIRLWMCKTCDSLAL